VLADAATSSVEYVVRVRDSDELNVDSGGLADDSVSSTLATSEPCSANQRWSVLWAVRSPATQPPPWM
jgi:hypothetical protein